MLLALIYFVLRRLVGLAGSSSSSDAMKERASAPVFRA